MFPRIAQLELVQPLHIQRMDTRVRFYVYIILQISLIGCSGGDELADRVPSGDSGIPAVFHDEASAPKNPAVQVQQELRGVSADGETALVRLSWTLTREGLSALRPNSRIRLRSYRNKIPGDVIETQSVSAETPSGIIDVPVNTESDIDRNWYIELDRADLSAVPGVTGFTVLSLGDLLRRNTTPLDRLKSVELSLIEGSYSAETVNNRREHRLTVSVSGQLVRDPDPLNPSVELTQPVNVTGLLADNLQPFTMVESGVVDTESPLTVTDQRKDPLVYLVMDASSSLQESECLDDLYHAITSTVITLAQSANFEYRVFDNEVYEVDSTLEFLPFEGAASGSALYYALDTVVTDILEWENRDRDIFIIAYSDGLDLASWNHYDFANRDDVITHVGRRLRALAQEHHQINDRSLKTFLLGFDPRTGSEAEEMLYLATQGGGEYIRMSGDDCDASLALQNPGSDLVGERVKETFLALTDHIRSVYHLHYSSQQTHGRSSLSLQLRLSDAVNHTLDLPARPIQ